MVCNSALGALSKSRQWLEATSMPKYASWLSAASLKGRVRRDYSPPAFIWLLLTCCWSFLNTKEHVSPWGLPPWFFFSSDEVPAVPLVSAGRVGKACLGIDARSSTYCMT